MTANNMQNGRLPQTRMIETQRERRGHDFYPSAELAAKIPRIYETDGQADQAVVHLHYFVGNCDWYITEVDPTGEAYGWADIGMGGEFGYVWLPELESLLVHGWAVVERDCYWTPVPLAQAIEHS